MWSAADRKQWGGDACLRIAQWRGVSEAAEFIGVDTATFRSWCRHPELQPNPVVVPERYMTKLWELVRKRGRG